jgi:hypothetical protein
MEQTHACRTPARLAFADHMHRLVTGNCAPKLPRRSENADSRSDQALDRPVILLQDVIEILHEAVLAIVGQIACGLEPGNGGRISGVLVGIDDPRRRMVLTAQGFGQKRSAAAASRLAERRKSIVAPLESTARYK